MTSISAESEKSFYFSDLLLIQEVEKNPVIWDTRLKGYRNEKAKAAIFRAIAEKLGKQVEDVEFRWYALRRTYVRRKKAALDKSPDGVAVISWPLYKYLSFLAPSVRHRTCFKRLPLGMHASKRECRYIERFVNNSSVVLRCQPDEILPNSSSDTPVILPVSNIPELSDDDMRWWNTTEVAEENPRQESPESNQNSMSPSSIVVKEEPIDIMDDVEISDVNSEVDKLESKKDANAKHLKSNLDKDKLDTEEDKLNIRKDKLDSERDTLHKDIVNLSTDINKLDYHVDELDRDNLDFFKSLLPMCRNFTNVQKLDFRLEVMNVVRKIMNSS